MGRSVENLRNLLDNHPVDQYIPYGHFRRRERKTLEISFKEIRTETPQIWGRKWSSSSKKTN